MLDELLVTDTDQPIQKFLRDGLTFQFYYQSLLRVVLRKLDTHRQLLEFCMSVMIELFELVILLSPVAIYFYVVMR